MSVLSEILSSKIRAEIFRLLFGIHSPELHLREIERRSGFSVGTVRQELIKLRRLDFLIKRVDGNRTYYRANLENPLYADIHSLVLKTVGLTDILKQHLKDEEIELAFVFGSVAAGSVNANSDIDLMVIGHVGLRRLSAVLASATHELGREINISVMHPQEFSDRKSRGEHFVTSILSAPKLMIRGSEDELTNLA